VTALFHALPQARIEARAEVAMLPGNRAIFRALGGLSAIEHRCCRPGESRKEEET
jgi:hypothetical protein